MVPLHKYLAIKTTRKKHKFVLFIISEFAQPIFPILNPMNVGLLVALKLLHDLSSSIRNVITAIFLN